MEFSRQEYCRGLPFPSSGDLSNPGIEPRLLHCRQTLYHLSHQGSPEYMTFLHCILDFLIYKLQMMKYYLFQRTLKRIKWNHIYSVFKIISSTSGIAFMSVSYIDCRHHHFYYYTSTFHIIYSLPGINSSIFFLFLFIKLLWHTIDLQHYISFRGIAKCISYKIHIFTLFKILFHIGYYWVEFSLLYSRSLSITYFSNIFSFKTFP